MPAITPTIARRYYPRLSEIVSVEELPEFLSFLQEASNAIFSKIHYKNLQYSKSYRGDSAFYSLDIVTKEPLALPLPGGLELVLNPDASNTSISSFPVALEYQWEILAYLHSFSLENFSFSLEAFYTIGLQVFRLDENQVFAQGLNFFTSPASDNTTKYEQLVTDINNRYTNAGFQLPQEPTVDSIVQAIRANEFLSTPNEVLFNIYIVNSDTNLAAKNLQRFFNIMVPQGIEAYIKNIITPKAKASLGLSAGLTFPREYLQPVYGPLGENPFGDPQPEHPLEIIPAEDAEGTPKVTLKFAEATFYADTQQGLGYALDLSIDTNTYAQIGNTGIIIYINNLKIDLSKTTNIPEADADGRPADFTGVYAQQLDVYLPKKWFKSIQEDTTLAIKGKTILVGTGGFSGTIALETFDGGNPPGETDYLWFNIGNENGFKIGFNAFDITFKQSKVISSRIRAALEVKKFKYPSTHPTLAGQPVEILVEGQIFDDGDFRLTGTVQDYPIVFPEVFSYNLKTAELGREGDDFYLGTSGTLQFEGFLKDNLNLGPIEIQRLRIYSDGSMEFAGGSISLLKPVVLELGPVDITVSAIHYGSHQKEVNGHMRKFNYFGFDGGLKVDPLGVEIRGDGVKFYYCTDDVEGQPKPNSYLHIQTLYLDLTIPVSSPVAVINGWLSIPDPGVSKEYAGGLKLQLPKVGITGSVNMKLMPRYPAFILDAEIEFPAPIPLGTFAIYGFRGLLGYRYVAEKEAIGLVSGVDTWYDYYKKPPRGIHVLKFSGPNQTSRYKDPFSIGAGASLGTSFDNGTVINLKVMILLSVPSLFMLDGRASILSARLGLEDTKDPPFFAMAAIGDHSLEFGFGADFKMPTSSGAILELYADLQAAFFFNDSSKWFVNLGTKEKPTVARILSLITLKSYLMLSAKGIEAGTRGEFDFQRNYAGIIRVHAWAYIEIGGKISFEKPQFGAYLDAGVGADINVKIVRLYASVQILFSVEAARPFLIYGKFMLAIRIKFLFFKFRFNHEVEVLWEKSKHVDREPISPMINASGQANISQLVKGVNMLSNETFELAYLGAGIPTGFDDNITKKIIPLDTYIDIKTEKGFLPAAVGNLIGGVNNAPSRYTDLVPPDKVVRGKELRQVKHQYAIESITIRSWKPAQNGNAGEWVDYHPYKAIYPNPNPSDPEQTAAYNNLKIGQFQKSDGQYNTIRILATTPFSYTEQGAPGWYIPEQYGLTSASLFCETDRLLPICADFLNKDLAQMYFCDDANSMFYSNEAAFLLIDKNDGDFAEVTNHPNIFNFAQSLAFKNQNKLQVIVPQPSVYIKLRLTSDSQGVRIKYYAPIINDSALEVQHGNPDPFAANPNEPFTIIVGANALNEPVIYDHPSWNAVSKIIIEPLYPNQGLTDTITEQIAAIYNHNDLVNSGLLNGEQQSATTLENQLQQIINQEGSIQVNNYLYNSTTNLYTPATDPQDWQTSWDTVTGHMPEGNTVGFYSVGNTIYIESNHQIIDVNLLPDIGEDYTVINNGTSVIIHVDNINNYLNALGELEFEITLFEDCKIDTALCDLYESLLQISEEFADPSTITAPFGDQQQLMELFQNTLGEFNKDNPDYSITKEFGKELSTIDIFVTVPDNESYIEAYSAAISILSGISAQGNCNCKATCSKDSAICNLHKTLLSQFESCMAAPLLIQNNDELKDIRICAEQLIDMLINFDTVYPSYNLIKIFEKQIFIVKLFIEKTDIVSYESAHPALDSLITQLGIKGNCSCNDCDKDEYLCSLHDSIKIIFDNCFIKPNEIKDNVADTIPCAIEIAQIIDDFIKKYPQYGINIKYPELNPIIKDFINNPTLKSYTSIYNTLSSLVNSLMEEGKCNCGDSDCEKDETLCALNDYILQELKDCITDPKETDKDNLPKIVTCTKNLVQQLFIFNEKNPDYKIWENLSKEIDAIILFNDKLSEETYADAYAAINTIVAYITAEGHCDCNGDCKKDETLCGLKDTFDELLENCIKDPKVVNEGDLPSIRTCVDKLLSEIKLFQEKYPQYEIYETYYERIKDIEYFIDNLKIEYYVTAYNAILTIVAGITTQGDCDCSSGCNCGEHCEKDDELCDLHNQIIMIVNNHIKNPEIIKKEDFDDIKSFIWQLKELIVLFDKNNPEYDIAESFELQMQIIAYFTSYPEIKSYAEAYQAIQYILADLSLRGNCTCGNENNQDLQDLYSNISEILSHLPTGSTITDFSEQVSYVNTIITLINEFNQSNPGFSITEYIEWYLSVLTGFINNPSQETYNNAVSVIQYILAYINQLGNYQFDVLENKTMLHSVCWLSLESYEFNANIPGIDAIREDTQATIDGITNYVQPVWRPDTSYIINFVLTDTVDNGTIHQFSFTYGFTTAGPVGYFHTNPAATYSDKSVKAGEAILIEGDNGPENYTVTENSILNDAAGKLRYADDGTLYPDEINNAIIAHPDNYVLTSLKQYIDYERSYPNADGNLLMAKPLFYNDDTTQIYLFFDKVYATHFFKTWEAYNGKPAINGRLKVVIKDPVEGTEIINPPYLDYNENDITTVHIPQTIEEWETDENPQMPFELNQWISLYNSNNCIIVGGDRIIPASEYISIALKHLKPSKLYGAIVNNLYSTVDNQFEELSETREVHRFVFRTSRYANFTEQVNSYLLTEGEGDETVTKKAVFTISKEFTPQQIDMAYKTMTGQSYDADAWITNYQHAYDRIFEGILGIEPLDEAISTEFNIIRNSADNDKVIAIIVRNPEPFNNPRMPLNSVADTLLVMAEQVPNNSYKVVFSKDYSQAIIMHQDYVITAPELDFKFTFKIWDGNRYVIPNINPVTNQIIDPTKRTGIVMITDLSI
ncbi:hypothetical protein GR160_13925 [Flavobacterium sp. Sd200]|uniref:hypothetical protein n=1 Tax=Flavobacterium sp. Sd200 TaxID=2692211 RepID=UPI00136D6C24|nr:hypothetical protein [Flavobacterium sp. Sd200]MXN92322.1 hypothetical protein [Flavobacterium sp. Sd200]